jgi:CubicO group peptidase (beta-lactamase class C family)
VKHHGAQAPWLITLRDLLTHTSGLRVWAGGKAFTQGEVDSGRGGVAVVAVRLTLELERNGSIQTWNRGWGGLWRLLGQKYEDFWLSAFHAVGMTTLLLSPGQTGASPM